MSTLSVIGAWGHDLTLVDYAVLVAYLIGTACLGLWMGRREKGERDYFIAERSVSWWAVLLSIVATETSALTFISVPGMAYGSDLTFIQIAFGYIAGRSIVAFTLLPRFYRGHALTAYEFLEKRFGPEMRRFASTLFLITRTLADAVRLFATAVPVAIIATGGIDSNTITIAVLVVSFFTWLYTFYGGMRAVIWTDVLQTTVYFIGAVMTIVYLHHLVPGGWSAILSEAAASGKLRAFDFSLTLTRPYSFFAGLIGGGVLSMASHGVDQIIVQRLLAARSLKESQRALIGSGIVVLIQFFLFLMIGIGLHSYFQHREFGLLDSVFPTFIAGAMPAGVKGLVLAGILAATMSAHSGALNSLAAATTHDIYLPLMRKRGSRAQESAGLRVGRMFTLFWAIVLTGLAFAFRDQKAPLVGVALSVASFTYGGLLGGFFLGILNRRARQRDAIVGVSFGISLMAIVVFAGKLAAAFEWLAFLKPLSLLAWPWYVLVGTAITIGFGSLAQRLLPKAVDARVGH